MREALHIEDMPELNKPILILGFAGLGQRRQRGGGHEGWMRLARRIQGLIDHNPELQAVIQEIMTSKTGGQAPGPVREDGTVIYLDDFFRPKG